MTHFSWKSVLIRWIELYRNFLFGNRFIPVFFGRHTIEFTKNTVKIADVFITYKLRNFRNSEVCTFKKKTGVRHSLFLHKLRIGFTCQLFNLLWQCIEIVKKHLRKLCKTAARKMRLNIFQHVEYKAAVVTVIIRPIVVSFIFLCSWRSSSKFQIRFSIRFCTGSTSETLKWR